VATFGGEAPTIPADVPACAVCGIRTVLVEEVVIVRQEGEAARALMAEDDS
jgi:hypothetical protein